MARDGDIEKDRAIKEALLVLGGDGEEDWNGGHFAHDSTCEGCKYELDEAVRILRKAIDLPVSRTVCLLCNKWCLLTLRGGETPPEGKRWRCSECDLWLSPDQYRTTVERKGDREGWNG